MARSYEHLTLDERRKLDRWRDAGVSVSEIAEKLGRARSTVYRELKRNHFSEPSMPKVVGYFAMAAHKMAEKRRRFRTKFQRHANLRKDVVQKIKTGWTPEQIAGRLRQENASLRVCHETIYRYIYSPEADPKDLWWHLPEHRRKRRPRKARKKHQPRLAKELSILFRPDVVARRVEFGHWEGDLIMFKKRFGNWNITSLIERVSRYTVLLKNPDRRSIPIMKGIEEQILPLPHHARRSITFDRGTEFLGWHYLKDRLGVDAWFCDPKAPWQKGAVENNNRRCRRWLPREIDLSKVSEGELETVVELINNTPRKCLGYKTPTEVFREQLTA